MVLEPKFLKLYKLYRYSLFPKIKNTRGATRLLNLIEDFTASRLIEEKEDHYEINLTSIEVKSSNYDDVRKIIDEIKSIETFLEKISENTKIADLGAYHGVYTIIGCKVSTKTVESFEIDENNIEVLQKNLDLNNIESHSYNIHKKAIWEESSSLKIETGKGEMNQVDKGSKEVQAISPDEAFQNTEWPDVAKIDIEGAEYKALTSSKTFLNNIDYFLLEIHKDPIISDFKHSYEQINDFLERKFDIEHIKENQLSKIVLCTNKESQQ